MNCPVCSGVSLVMSERSGVEIDYCPKCRGVWLDRGELDKIIEKSAAASVAPIQQETYRSPDVERRAYEMPSHQQQQHHQSGSGYYKKKKSGGFLGELFDFD